TYQEIARETGVSVKTVEYRISLALKKLRLSLADYLALIPILCPFLFNHSA
ncbi:MAG: RNA polymerase sigma-70 factor, partial [Bacteroidales bacterium]|nr:RNA polymerase sigma-70 factor [Bacteroidales bacterium]